MGNRVLIMADEEELIVSLYQDYMIRHGLANETVDHTRMSVKAFSDYIMEYLKDRYNLDDEEETDD